MRDDTRVDRPLDIIDARAKQKLQAMGTSVRAGISQVDSGQGVSPRPERVMGHGEPHFAAGVVAARSADPRGVVCTERRCVL